MSRILSETKQGARSKDKPEWLQRIMRKFPELFLAAKHKLGRTGVVPNPVEETHKSKQNNVLVMLGINRQDVRGGVQPSAKGHPIPDYSSFWICWLLHGEAMFANTQ